MTDRYHATSGHDTDDEARFLIETGIEQVKVDCRLYDEAVESYNTHLQNHRDRRNLHDVPFRRPISNHDAFTAVLHGNKAALDELLAHLLNQPHLDSQLRRHPRTYPIHLEALEHLEIARDQLVRSLEEFYRDLEET